MNEPIHYILIKKEGKWVPKSAEISSFEQDDAGMYRVRFTNSSKYYRYSRQNLAYLGNRMREWVDPAPDVNRIFLNGQELSGLKDVWHYAYDEQDFWRIVFHSGRYRDYPGECIRVVTNCLCNSRSNDVFDYLKHIAGLNPLGKNGEPRKNETVQGILEKQYAAISYVGDDTVASLYLGYSASPKRTEPGNLIYPFGSNASQKEAVRQAFTHQVSIVQGPPGTGKTQTILNILANIVMRGKTALVVSANNSATDNIREKLAKYGLDFMVAPLGNKENKGEFIRSQPPLPEELPSWHSEEVQDAQKKVDTASRQLDAVFSLQNDLAVKRQELEAANLEWEHFKQEHALGEEDVWESTSLTSGKLLRLWLELQPYVDEDAAAGIHGWSGRFRWLLLKFLCRYWFRLTKRMERENLLPLITRLQTLYYPKRRRELCEAIAALESALERQDAGALMTVLTENSLLLLKDALCRKYRDGRPVLVSEEDLWKRSSEVLKQYPIVLSTTFSARSCLAANTIYDYVIVDEASQVAVETGFLALTCARNAVIVGDSQQLPNVVTEDDRKRFKIVQVRYHLAEGYDCASYSLLTSIGAVIKEVPQTLLCEHYRCHPRIINFCNQKFYGGQLLIMTPDTGEENVLSAFTTVAGNHARNKCNQREIDVIRSEVFPALAGFDDVGIVTPYNNQVDVINKEFGRPDLAATVHKYQGRENDAIVFSAVDNQITPFCDDDNMLNVAVSRAKKKFCLVMTGEKQEKEGNLTDLLHYISYQNCAVVESKVSSIFDYLYEHYTKERLEYLERHPKVSEYDSENLLYPLILKVLEEGGYAYLKVVLHYPLRSIFRHKEQMLEQREYEYASHAKTHVDFLLFNRVSKLPVMGIEVNGYSFHREGTEQSLRDELKESVFRKYDLPLLVLSTTGSGEEQKIKQTLVHALQVYESTCLGGNYHLIHE